VRRYKKICEKKVFGKKRSEIQIRHDASIIGAGCHHIDVRRRNEKLSYGEEGLREPAVFSTPQF
jgi:hypothetical protein